jgi:heme-degrading monooxygenase HmoA
VNDHIVTVFRSRLRDPVPDDFAPLATELEARARTFPGFLDFKEFTAAYGERLALVTFASAEAEVAWRDDPAHRAAQQQGRDRFYAEYDIAVCSLVHRHSWPAREA